MSAGTRRPLAEARALADEVVGLLADACERIEIAGSIRRSKEDAGDIEIIAIPKTYQADVVEVDLFGNPAQHGVQMSRLETLCRELIERGAFETRPNKDGKIAVGWKLKWLMYRGFPLDIYICEFDTWAVTMALRTGPADFSKQLVTAKRFGGLCPSHLEFKGWRVRDRRSGEPLETPEEPDVFRVLGIDYIPPELRDRALAGAI